MTLRAQVTRTTGRTVHRSGRIEDGKLVPGEVFETPAWVEIEATDEGFFLLSFDAAGRGMTDTWHQTLEQAKAQARFEFEIEDAEWLDTLGD